MEELRQLLKGAVKTCFDEEVETEVSYTDPKFGDFATNVAFKLAGKLGQSPAQIADRLAEQLLDINGQNIEKVVAANGFINITMASRHWVEVLDKIGENFGSNNVGGGKKTQVEFISANPTGPLTLANARGGFLGDVLARVLDYSNYEVVREFYCNDYGNQITKLVESVKVEAGLLNADEVQYKGAYIKELAEELKAELAAEPDEKLGPILTETILSKYIKPAVGRMGIRFDVWFSERDLVKTGQNIASRERLKQEDLLYEKDGAVWLKTTELGDQRDRVLVRSGEGVTTYLDQDIAYHLNIFEKRKFDLAIKLFGPDNAAQFPSLQVTIKKLVPKAELRLLVFQSVRLIKDGKEVKMSKRAGTFVTTDELVEEVGADVARFFFLMRSADSHMDFDLGLAKETSQKNPYWYVMYSFARANSILREAAKVGLGPDSKIGDINKREAQIIKQVSRFPELIKEIAIDYGVHRLTFFGIELAKLFHDYYESERIIKLSQKEAGTKLYLIQQYRDFMRVYFSVLGITAKEKM